MGCTATKATAEHVQIVYYGETKQAWPELYNNPKIWQKEGGKPGQLTPDQIDTYYKDGYLVLRDFHTSESIKECLDDIESMVDVLANRLYEGGKIKSLHKEEDVRTRMCKIEEEFPGAIVLILRMGTSQEAFLKLWTNDRMLNITEQLLGPNVAGHPQLNLRPKTPNNPEVTVPWHQDVGYTDNEHYGVHVVTTWVPLQDVDEHNGCLQFYRGGHKTGRIGRHTCCAGPTFYISLDENEMQDRLGVDLEKDLVTLPMKAGDILLFNNHIPHRSLENHSDAMRWSLDLRYQATDKPIGYYGIKDKVEFRRENEPDMKINFGPMMSVNKAEAEDRFGRKPANDYDTTLTGPWMTRWQIVHMNRHVQTHLDEKR